MPIMPFTLVKSATPHSGRLSAAALSVSLRFDSIFLPCFDCVDAPKPHAAISRCRHEPPLLNIDALYYGGRLGLPRRSYKITLFVLSMTFVGAGRARCFSTRTQHITTITSPRRRAIMRKPQKHDEIAPLLIEWRRASRRRPHVGRRN